MADNIQYGIAVPEAYEIDGKGKPQGRPSRRPFPMTVRILPVTLPNTWPSRAGWCYSRRFHVESAIHEFGDKFFIEKEQAKK